MGRGDVRWRQIAIRLPDDGTDALPLLRNVILNDSKSSTYKLGLLRVLCRIADGAFGLAEEQGEDHVAVPMGLVALTWIRLYKPLINADAPQSPVNDRGGHKLGFVKHAGVEQLDVSHHDLRVGARFSGDDLAALHQSLLDVTSTIVRMPVRYMTYPNSDDPILPVRHSGTTRRPSRSADGRLTAGYLASFGTLRVPIHLWMAIRRLSVWIEPAIVAEWKLLMRTYADRQDRQLDEQTLADAMKWLEPERDVRLAREEADRLMAAGPVHCVWTGRKLSRRNLDIDHCFPWAIWPCGDLWNLMPAHRQVNQHEKRNLLPGDRILRQAEERILVWWNEAYRSGTEPGPWRPLRRRSRHKPPRRVSRQRPAGRLLRRTRPSALAPQAQSAGTGMDRRAVPSEVAGDYGAVRYAEVFGLRAAIDPSSRRIGTAAPDSIRRLRSFSSVALSMMAERASAAWSSELIASCA